MSSYLKEIRGWRKVGSWVVVIGAWWFVLGLLFLMLTGQLGR